MHLLQDAFKISHFSKEIFHLGFSTDTFRFHFIEGVFQLCTFVRHIMELDHFFLEVTVLDGELCVEDWRDLAAKPRLADAVIVSTQDKENPEKVCKKLAKQCGKGDSGKCEEFLNNEDCACTKPEEEENGEINKIRKV